MKLYQLFINEDCISDVEELGLNWSYSSTQPDTIEVMVNDIKDFPIDKDFVTTIEEYYV